MSIHRAAEKALARKYGQTAHKTMHNWGAVRNRLDEVIYQRQRKWKNAAAVIIPTLLASIASAALTSALALVLK